MHVPSGVDKQEAVAHLHWVKGQKVVTRMLKHLAADGVIEVTRKGILIADKKKLRSIAY